MCDMRCQPSNLNPDCSLVLLPLPLEEGGNKGAALEQAALQEYRAQRLYTDRGIQSETGQKSGQKTFKPNTSKRQQLSI